MIIKKGLKRLGFKGLYMLPLSEQNPEKMEKELALLLTEEERDLECLARFVLFLFKDVLRDRKGNCFENCQSLEEIRRLPIVVLKRVARCYVVLLVKEVFN